MVLLARQLGDRDLYKNVWGSKWLENDLKSLKLNGNLLLFLANEVIIYWLIDRLIYLFSYLFIYLFIHLFIYLFIYSFIINHSCTRYILHILLGHPLGTHLLILNLKELRDSDSVISLGTKSHIFGPR